MLLVGGLLAAGCSSGDDDADAGAAGPDDATDEEEVTVDRDATLRFGVTVAPISLDPHRERNTGESRFLWQVWDRLLMLDNDQQLQPGIAEEWSFSDDGLTLTLELRDDARFHDGSPVQADDVKASLDRARTLEGSTVKGNLALVEEVVASDEDTVEIRLVEPAPFLPIILSTSTGAVISADAIAAGVDIGSDPNDASSGAYIVEEFIPDERAVYTRAPGDYWDPDAGQAARVEFRVFDDGQAAMAALKTDVVDIIIGEGERGAIEAAIQGTDLQFLAYPAAGLITLFLNPAIEPLDDPRVRAAIVSAIDRRTAAEAFLGGEEYFTSQGVDEDSIAYDPDFDPFPYDPEEARRLLAEAGHEDGFTLDMMFPAGFAPAEANALSAQSQLAELGIDVRVNAVPSGDVIGQWQSGTVASYMTASGTAQPDPYLMVERHWHGLYRASDPNLDAALVEKMEVVRDPSLSDAERAEAYREMLQEAILQATVVPMGFRPAQFVYQPDVLNVEEMPWSWASDSGADPRYLAIAAAG